MHTCSRKFCCSKSLLSPVTTMNPTQPNVPDTGELCFWALEQAYANSLATQDNMQKQINRLLHSFQQLEEFMWAEKKSPPSPIIRPIDLTPIWATPTGWPPPPALPSEYNGNHSKGQAFLTLCQTYICLCPDSFPGNTSKLPGLYCKGSTGVASTSRQ